MFGQLSARDELCFDQFDLFLFVRRPFYCRKYSYRSILVLSLENITRGPSARDIAASQHHHLPSCMARVGPILQLWAQDSHFAVRPSSHGIRSRLKWGFDSILMQWAEGGSLDDYIDARLGRPTHPHITALHRKTIRPLIYTLARLAFRAMQGVAPSKNQALPREAQQQRWQYVDDCAPAWRQGGSWYFLAASQLGSGFWCAEFAFPIRLRDVDHPWEMQRDRASCVLI